MPEINNTEVVGFNTNFQMEGEAEHKEKKLRIERKRNNRTRQAGQNYGNT